MSTGLLTVTKSAAGEEWANTYGISVGSDNGALTLADLEGIIATNPADGFTDENTQAATPEYEGGTSILAAILGFERQLHYSAVQIVRLTINDGSTPGTPTGNFWSQAINLAGNKDGGSPVDAALVAPLSIALLVNRNPAGLSIRPGRVYYRGCLLDTDVRPGSRVGVTWRDDGIATSVRNFVTGAVTAAELDSYFASPSTTLPAIYVSIPHYDDTDPDVGQVISGSPVTSFSANKPVSRQLTRGRRRAVAP